MIHELCITDDVVSLRPLVHEDIEMLRVWRNEDGIRHCFVDNNLITPDQQAQWFERYKTDVTDFMFISEYKNEPVGVSALYNLDFNNKVCEFGRLMLGNIHLRGLGLGKRITFLTTRLGFESLGLRRIYLEVFKDNVSAKRIYEALGYCLIYEVVKNGRSCCLMEIIKKDV